MQKLALLCSLVRARNLAFRHRVAAKTPNPEPSRTKAEGSGIAPSGEPSKTCNSEKAAQSGPKGEPPTLTYRADRPGVKNSVQ